MKREEFYEKVTKKLEELEDLVNELPNIEELDDDFENYDQSKSAYLSEIINLDINLANLSDLYFDEA